MKLIIQVPCYNEESTLPLVIASLPREIPGVSTIEYLVIDDGSRDRTSEVARELGVHYVIKNTINLGLAYTFQRGVDECLARGADLIVNIDGDNQYRGADIPALVAPILAGRADIVVGDRQTDTITEFSPLKKVLQRLGSFVVRRLAGSRVTDTTSGFRAFSRRAAFRLTVLSYFTYTHETILQARQKGLAIDEVKITVNPKTRESRLFRSMRAYIAFSLATILRVFTMYNALRVFFTLGALFIGTGSLLACRFLFYYFQGRGNGLVQSLIFGAIFILAGVITLIAGIVADLIQFNRRLIEDVLERVKRIELNEDRRH